jgi:hypothetical protein
VGHQASEREDGAEDEPEEGAAAAVRVRAVAEVERREDPEHDARQDVDGVEAEEGGRDGRELRHRLPSQLAFARRLRSSLSKSKNCAAATTTESVAIGIA